MNFLGRLIFGLILTAGMYYFYNKNVLSKLDVDAQMVDYEFEEYEREDEEDEDNHYAYDDYDTGSNH